MAATPEHANVVSLRLIEEAIAHVDRHLSDTAWLKVNRMLQPSESKFAFWELNGIGRLTQKEMEAVSAIYMDKGWRYVMVRPRFHDTETNWHIHIQAEL